MQGCKSSRQGSGRTCLPYRTPLPSTSVSAVPPSLGAATDSTVSEQILAYSHAIVLVLSPLSGSRLKHGVKRHRMATCINPNGCKLDWPQIIAKRARK